MLLLFRATLLLVPLLGINYLLTPFRPDKDHPWLHFYEMMSAITSSLQVRFTSSFQNNLNNRTDKIFRLAVFARVGIYECVKDHRFPWLLLKFLVLFVGNNPKRILVRAPKLQARFQRLLYEIIVL